ncbi:MAG: 6-phosphofructokinase [Planctomycetes bacterium]|nr:6-phosphofructokinase [Planctomycetota bacterium]
MKIGVLTGGGDCPGLNAVIRAVVQTIHNAGGVTLGLMEGWRGAIEGQCMVLTPEKTEGIIGLGGTILGSSRTNPYKNPGDVERLVNTFHDLELEGLIAIGGDDTLGVASQLYDDRNLPTIGCPKTIDNDLSSTDQTFGFDTSINIVMDAVDRLRTTAESHRRIIVVETMGRHAGWIACHSGMATAADYILVPEVDVDLDRMCEILIRRRQRGKMYGIVVVSEGARLASDEELVTQNSQRDDFGHVKLGGIGDKVAEIIHQRTGLETRCIILGHLQRGGPPSAYDRVLGTRMGVHAARLSLKKEFGRMVSLQGTEIVNVTLADAVKKMRTLSTDFYGEAEEFFH